MTERKKAAMEVPGTYAGLPSCSSSSSEGFLWTEQKTHIMGVLPYLTLLLCPLKRFFTQRGQEGQNGTREGSDNNPGWNV